jgi:hypothetical protein
MTESYHLILDVILQSGSRAYIAIPATTTQEELDAIIETLQLFRDKALKSAGHGKEGDPA